MHPLDNLTAQEISSVSLLIKQKLASATKTVFNSITLQEPPKAVLLPFLNGEIQDDIPRRALAILIEKGTGNVTEVVVNLTSKVIETWTIVEKGYQPTLSPDDCFDAERIAKSDPKVIERARVLGYENVDLVVADPWSIGYSGDEPEFENKRLVQLFMYAREFDEDNHYAHPLDFVTVVDLNLEKVVRIEDLPSHSDFAARTDKPVKIPRKPLNYDPEHLSKDFLRSDVKPLQIQFQLPRRLGPS
ncbi:unnamed protein product [Allacma fusca]|uniref:Amine oxidase n=1 Tax=Allacma fusca TaxID=39272 RepID=A0A8J2LTW4_9HEXA|nr:unnamed protein product [Allacma fusca]